MDRLAIILGAALVISAIGLAPIPLEETLIGPHKLVTIYPNVLFAVPLILLGALLLLYGFTAKGLQETCD